MKNVLLSVGFKKSKHQPCVFYLTECFQITIVALYVDDFLVFSNCMKRRESIKQCLKEKFNVKDLGGLKHCLGMDFHREGGIILC